jgi:hypothetical protein
LKLIMRLRMSLWLDHRISCSERVILLMLSILILLHGLAGVKVSQVMLLGSSGLLHKILSGTHILHVLHRGLRGLVKSTVWTYPLIILTRVSWVLVEISLALRLPRHRMPSLRVVVAHY